MKMNNSSWVYWKTDLDSNLAGKITTGVVMSMSIFLNGFVFLVALFSKRLRKSGYNLTTISLSFTDFLMGLTIRPLITLMSDNHPVSYNSCAIALAAYITCIQASSFHVLIIACLRCYAIKKTSLTRFKFELRNATLAILFTWFLAICSTSLTFLMLSKRTFPPNVCSVKNVFGEQYKLYMKVQSMILLLCSLGLVSMYIILGLNLYSRQVSIRSVHPINIDSSSAQNKTNNTVCNGFNDNVSNSSLVTVREMALPNNERETTEDTHRRVCKFNSTSTLMFVNQKQSGEGSLQLRNITEQQCPNHNTTTDKMNCCSNDFVSSKHNKSELLLNSKQISDKNEQSSPKIQDAFETNENVKQQNQNGNITCDEKANNPDVVHHREQEHSDKMKNKNSNNFIHTIKSRNQKSLITVSIIVLLHLILNGPYYLFLFAEGYFIDAQGDAVVRTVLFCISTLHSVFNPLVYVARISGFKEVIKDRTRSIKNFFCKPGKDNE